MSFSVEWFLTDPIGIGLLISVHLVAVLAGYRSLLAARGRQMAQWIVNGGHFELAPPLVQEQLIEFAASRGQADLAQLEMATIRRLYGHDQVRIGHILWVMEILEGRVTPGEKPPAFNGSAFEGGVRS